MQEEAEYTQFTIQIEYDMPYDISFISQYILYDRTKYSSIGLPIDDAVNITNLEFDPDEFDPSKIFMPGMGSPLSIMSNKALMLSFERKFIEDQLKVNMLSLIDVDNEGGGSLIELGLEYSLLDGFNILGAITNISGNSNHSDGGKYTFNQMEEFSHFRLEMKYYF